MTALFILIVVLPICVALLLILCLPYLSEIRDRRRKKQLELFLLFNKIIELLIEKQQEKVTSIAKIYRHLPKMTEDDKERSTIIMGLCEILHTVHSNSDIQKQLAAVSDTTCILKRYAQSWKVSPFICIVHPKRAFWFMPYSGNSYIFKHRDITENTITHVHNWYECRILFMRYCINQLLSNK